MKILTNEDTEFGLEETGKKFSYEKIKSKSVFYKFF